MVFVRHERRKNQGTTSASQMVRCYKCEKEIEMGAVFYSKFSHSRYTHSKLGFICEPCYQSFYIDL